MKPKKNINKNFLKIMLSRKNIASILVCLILSLTFIFLVRGVQKMFTFRDTGLFDYNDAIERGYDWTGPKSEENINLDYFENAEAVTIPKKITTHQLTLITIVDPECGVCELAKDQINYLEEETESYDCNYAIASFSQKLSYNEFSKYLEARNISANSFLWVGGVENILPSINKMVLPSHILVDRRGTVIESFAGTDKEKSVRERMTNRIVKEIKDINNKVQSNQLR